MTPPRKPPTRTRSQTAARTARPATTTDPSKLAAAAQRPARAPEEPLGWQPATPPGENPPPPRTAPFDPVERMREQNPDKTVSSTSFDLVDDDGSTARITPGYSTAPCPVCANTTVRETTVQSAEGARTFDGDTVEPGKGILVCDSCGQVVATGDAKRFEQAAAKQAARDQDADERNAINRERSALDQRERQLATTTTKGGDDGDS